MSKPSLVLIARMQDKLKEPGHSISYKVVCRPAKTWYQPAHPHRIVRDFAVHLKTLWSLSHLQSTLRILWSDCAGAQTDQSIRLEHTQSCRTCCGPAHYYNDTNLSRLSNILDGRRCLTKLKNKTGTWLCTNRFTKAGDCFSINEGLDISEDWVIWVRPRQTPKKWSLCEQPILGSEIVSASE